MTYHQASWLININKFVIGKFYEDKYVADLVIIPAGSKLKKECKNTPVQLFEFLNDCEQSEFDVAVMLEYENTSLKEAGKNILIPFFDFFQPEKVIKIKD